jgi:hypothetical protein
MTDCNCPRCQSLPTKHRLADERDLAVVALEQIHGHFLPNERNTYLPGDQTLDKIRQEASDTLKALRAMPATSGCICVGTPDQEDCPHE